MKIHKRYATLLFVFLMVVMMTSVTSFVNTARTVGLSSQFVFTWLQTFTIGFLISFPTAMVAVPLVRRIVASVTQE